MKSELTIKTYTPAEIAALTGGDMVLCCGAADACITSVCTDSREVTPGALFCAIRGERTDGHRYIKQVIEAGAACVLAEEVPDEVRFCGCAVIRVPNTVFAIGTLAGDYRDHSSARVIAVTGSVGKTTTKEFIAAVASESFATHKTEENHNNDLGLSMSLFRLRPEHAVSVLEMGMSNRGEIERMSQLAKPDFAVITNIGTSHLASLGTRENICRAKMEITAGMRPEGTLLLNMDEPLLAAEAERRSPRPLGMSVQQREGNYRAVNIRTLEDGMLYDMICEGRVLTNIRLPVLGTHNVVNSLAAYAVGCFLGMSEDSIRRGLMNFSGAAMRQRIYEMNDITVIEDCYNASPESMRAALDVLAAVAQNRGGTPTALLGDMLELGEDSRLMHDQLGQYAAQKHVVKLFCYGKMADVVAEAAIKRGVRAENVCVCLNADDPETMADMVTEALAPGDVLLVKASRGVAAERVLACMQLPRRRRKRNFNS